MVTPQPFFDDLPRARGSGRTRRRWRTLALAVEDGTGVRPARLSLTLAACSVSPITSGTVTRPTCGMKQHAREDRQDDERAQPARPQPAPAAGGDPRRRSRAPRVGAAGRRQQQRPGAPERIPCGGPGGAAAAAPADSGRARRSRWSAAMNSSASAKRCAGSLASARSTTASSAARHRGVQRARRARLGRDLLEGDRHGRLAVERDHAGEQLVQDHADRVEVGRLADRRGPGPARGRGTGRCP